MKHTARDLAKKSSVPIVPGTEGLVDTEEDALRQSETIGYPVMLKITAGGGGMLFESRPGSIADSFCLTGSGLITCYNPSEVKDGYKKARSRGEALFKDSGVFIEKYYPQSHHIEVQVFGNGQGKAVSFGEREVMIRQDWLSKVG